MNIRILEIEIDRLNRSQTLERIEEAIKSHRRLIVATANPEFLMQARRDPEFRRLLEDCDLRLPDGVGLLWAATFLQLPWRGRLWGWWQLVYSAASLLLFPSFCREVITEQVQGSWLVPELARLAPVKKWRVFLLGAAPGVAERVAEIWKEHHPGIEVEASAADPDDESVLSKINSFKPDLVLVAYGAKGQLSWLHRRLPELPPAVGIGIGGTLDYLAGATPLGAKRGKARRVPKVVQNLGLEWLWRLTTQPWRWQRILTAVPYFMKAVLDYKQERNASEKS